MATIRIGGTGLALGLLGQTANRLSLTGGQSYTIPAGQWSIDTGPYAVVQFLDPISGIWLNYGSGPYESAVYVTSDGANFRIINPTGTMVGAIVTTAGSGYTSAPTVTASAGGSTWTAIVGGLVSTSVTVGSGGSGYSYPPICLISAPPVGGLQATAVCTLSAGAVNAVTITNQGAGYTSAPTITFVQDPRDPGSPTAASATLTLTGSGTIAAVLCTNGGTAVTSVPTLSFSGGGGSSAAATAIGNFTVTAYAVTSGGTGYGTGTFVTTSGGIVTTAGAYTNPLWENRYSRPRNANILAGLSSGAISATGQNVIDGGFGFQLAPNAVPVAGTGLSTAVATLTATIGSATANVTMQPI